MKKLWILCCVCVTMVMATSALATVTNDLLPSVGNDALAAKTALLERMAELEAQIEDAKLAGNVSDALYIEYFALVSGMDERSLGMSLDEGGEDCSDATDLGSALGQNVAGGSTVGAVNDFPYVAGVNAPCYRGTRFDGSGNGPDRTYKWTAPRSSIFTFSMCGSNYDTEISIWQYTCPDQPSFPEDYICGNDDATQGNRCPGANLASVLNCLELTAGQEVLIVIDGYDDSAGEYALSIIDCNPPCPSDHSMAAPGTFTGTTCDAGNNCNLRNTSEVQVAVEIPHAGVWSFRYDGFDWDPVLFIGYECCTADICFNDDYIGLNSACPCVYLEAGTVYVTLEGFAGCGPFVFSVTEGTCGRCCYTQPTGAPGCATAEYFECAAIGGVWTEGLTCEENPCQLGRCCYFDDGEPVCESNTRADFCVYALGGEWSEGLTCDAPCPSIGDCGPIDLVLSVDVTGSMGGSLENIIAQLPSIIAVANQASGGDLRLGLLTFYDDVQVLHPLTNDIAAVQASIAGLFAAGGLNAPEASDESLREIISGDGQCVTVGDFNVPFRAAAAKIVVVITDASNGGCDDAHDGGDVAYAHQQALDALAAGIRICPVWRPRPGAEPFDIIVPVLQDYAATTGGTFTQTAPNGSGAGGALYQIIANCGQGDLHLSSAGTDLRCDPNGGGITTPTFDITVTTENTGTATCTNASLNLSNISSTAGAVVLNSANPVALGDLAPGASVNTQFNLTVTPDADGGQVVLTFNLSSDDCPPNVLSVTIDVPDCDECVGDEEVYMFEDDGRIPPGCLCAYLCLGQPLHVFVCGTGLTPGHYPILTITPGCMTDDCAEECNPAEFLFSETGWTLWGDSCWHNLIIPQSDGCVCICFDRYLPVELNGFTAIARDGEVELTWSTASETNNDRFEITRDGVLAGVVAASNNATGADYRFVDRGLENGRMYRYELASVSLDGQREVVAQREAAPQASAAVVTELALGQNFPNPFNPETNITFDLVEDGVVSLEVFNAVGQKVATLVNGSMNAGRHNVTFRADGLPSGLYFYRLTASATTLQKKMLLLK